MSKNSKQHPIASATNGNVYEIQEMPILRNAIRMEIDWLKLFCNDRSLPLFCLKVGEEVHEGVAFQVKVPYKKFFTICQDWMFYAVERLHTDSEERCAVEMRT